MRRIPRVASAPSATAIPASAARLCAERDRHEDPPQGGHRAEAARRDVQRQHPRRAPGQLGAEREADQQDDGGGHHGPGDRAQDRPQQQHRPRHGREQEPVEPALLDVAREVGAGRRSGEAGALQARQRDDPGQVGVRREAVQAGQAPELPADAEEEDDRRDGRRQQCAAHARDLVERARPQGPDDTERARHYSLRRRFLSARVATAVLVRASAVAAPRPTHGLPRPASPWSRPRTASTT
jgi:hypothetical protein